MPAMRFFCLVGFLAIVPLSIGCSKQDPNRGEVSGMVEVDGQPAAEGAISFYPLDGNTAGSGGDIVNGRYTVNANVGLSKVSINVPKVVGQRKVYNTPDSPTVSVTEEALPPQYNEQTTLTHDVTPGPNEKNFSLKTK
jgi:hypothetical protein